MLKLILFLLSIILCYFVVYANTDLKVVPEMFIDPNKPFVEFNCETYLYKGQWLSWYQEQPSQPKPIFLTTYKQIYESGDKTLELVLPLISSNNGSTIYCIKEIEELNWVYQVNGYKTISRTSPIEIIFQRENEPSGNFNNDLGNPQVTPETYVDNGESIPAIKFTCWAYLLENQRLSWYQVKGSSEKDSTIVRKLAHAIQENSYGYVKVVLRKTLEPSDLGTEIFCANETVLSNRHIEKGLESQRIPLTIQRNPIDIWGPWVEPKTFIDDGRASIEYICSAYLYQKEVLSWFQTNESNKHIRLAISQQTSFYGIKDIPLHKTLEPTDNGSKIYCAKENILFEDNSIWNFETREESQRISINFQGMIRPSDIPYVTMEPRRGIMLFDEGDTFDFYCSGSQPLDGRSYTLHIKGPQYTKDDLLFHYDHVAKPYHAYLFMKRDFHMNQLYCAQDYNVDLTLPDDKQIKYFYNELTRSGAITLLLRHGFGQYDDKPLVTPKFYKDESKQFMEFECFAFVPSSGFLAWYQTKESHPSPYDTLLRMHQSIDTTGKWINLTLKKTLEQSDKDTNIYCAKHRTIHGNFLISEMIPITFERYIEPLEKQYVTIEPEDDVIFFDERQTLKLNCSGSAPVDGRSYTWYKRGPYPQQDLQLYPDFDKSTNSNNLQLKLDQSYHQSLLFCAQDYRLHLFENGYSYIFSYGELARSNAIRLLNRTQGDSKDEPQVTPKTFKDQGKPFINFTCYAFLLHWEVLSWYQSTELNTPETLLRTIQLQHSKTGQWMKLTLKKTLDRSDKGSKVYCAKQTVMLNGNYSEGLDRLDSQPILLKFHRDILPLNPYVTIEPKSKVYFEVNSIVSFNCSGSVPVDGRRYTWFIVDAYNTVTIAKKQSYDTSTNLNVLKVFLNETNHHNQLYCAQGFLWKVRDSNKFNIKFYGEIAKSSMITLVQRGKGADQETAPLVTSGNAKTLSVTLPLVLVVLAAVSALWALRKRRATPPSPDSAQDSNSVIPVTVLAPHAKPADTVPPKPLGKPADTASTLEKDERFEGDYVSLTDMNSKQVTYAVLDLPKKTANIRATKPFTSANIRGAPKTSSIRGKSKKSEGTVKAVSESSHYAEIVGVYKPPKQTKPQ